MTNAISATKQHKCDNIVLNKANESVTSFRDFTFLLFITTNCIWRACAHDSSNSWDAIRGLSETKGSKSMGATPGTSVGESLLFQQMEQISRNVFFPSSPELAGAARSGECDQPLCLSVLSGEICGVTWAIRASQLSGKIITQSRTFWITSEAIGRSGCGMDLCVTKTPLNETFPHLGGQEPERELMNLRRTGQDELLTFTHPMLWSCSTWWYYTVCLHQVFQSICSQ